MSATAKNMELLRKLKALAERGIGGEKETARNLLDRLMKKYGVEEVDLSDEAVEEHGYSFSTEWERKLLHQLFFKIAEDREVYRYKYGEGARTKLFCVCTKAEAVQISVEYDFYRELWKDELGMFFLAFVQKHKIFSDRPSQGGPTLSGEELHRLAMMMEGLQDKSLLLMIEDGTSESGNE